ncbi:hypothetical protein [Nocardia stercoris]|nr:hypothetical protein [Nocardia stercoris]
MDTGSASTLLANILVGALNQVIATESAQITAGSSSLSGHH